MNAQQILSGLGWSAIATVVSATCQLVFMAVLARLLDPAAFGLMAMAAIALRFAGFFSQMGFAQAIIQKPELNSEDTAAALCMALGFGALLYLVMALAAPLFAAGFRADELAPLIRVLGLTLILGTVASLPMALLRRRARFKRVNAIEVFAFVAGYGAVGIFGAIRGWGVWSLVAATLSQQALILLLGFAATRYPLSWPVSRPAFAALWASGSRYSLIGFLEFLAGNFETMFIGRHFGKADLGLFNRATMLTNLPVELGVSAVNKVLFPALAAMQHDRKLVADGFQMLLLTVGMFSTAMACGIAAAAPDVVTLLLGAKWATIAPMVAIVALAVPATFMFVVCGITLDSLAALTPKLRLQLVMLVVKVALVLALSHWGLVAIAVAVVLADSVRLAFGMRLVASLLDIDGARLWRLVGLFVATGAAVSSAVGLAAVSGHAAHLSVLACVMLESGAGGLVLVGFVATLLVRFPDYSPLQRFETVRRWHARALGSLTLRAVQS